MKKVLLGLLIVLVLLVVGAISAVGWQIVLGPDARPVTNRTFERSDARLARGQYLVENVASCFHCHSEHDMNDPAMPVKAGMKGAGWEMPIPELGHLVAPNITPDVATGIGSWTDDEIARAIQEGVNKQGKALFPMMPYMNFRNFDDEDLASVVVYLRSIPAVSQARERSRLITPLNVLVKTMPKPLTSHPAPVARTSAQARGEYLVRTVAGCQDCHTPSDDRGQPLPGMDFAGGFEFHDPSDHMKPLFSLNITHDPSGIAHYDEALFVQTIKTGRLASRAISPIMPIENYHGMEESDLRDIFAYLQSVPHVQHRISNTDPPAKCLICNQVHGLGELNAAPAKK
jgi:mono/diheme cytochrome c family protein